METYEQSEIAKRIKAIINYLGISETKFSKEIGVAQSVINSMFRRNTEPSFKVLNAILTEYEYISANWLLHGEGEMIKQDTQQTNHSTEVKHRLIEFIESIGVTIREFERKCNLSNGYIKGLKHSPSANKLNGILKRYPQLNRVWLLTGEKIDSSCIANNTETNCIDFGGSINERIRALVNFLGVTGSKFASMIGVPQTTISNILTSDTNPGYKILNAISNNIESLSTDWLLLGKGEMFVNSDIEQTIDLENRKQLEYTKDRIKQVIEYKNCSVNAFSKMIGVNQSTIQQQLTEDRKISLDIIEKILITFEEISSDWLIMGKGEMLKQLQPFMAQPLESDSRNHSNNVLESIKQKEIDEMKLQMDREQKLMSQLLRVIDNNTIIIKNLSEEIVALKTMMKGILKSKEMEKDSVSYWANSVRVDADGFEEV